MTSTLSETLSGLISSGDPSAYFEAARALEQADTEALRSLRVAILSSFTSEPLQPYLLVEGARRELDLAPYFAPFNQFEQQVLDADGPLYAFAPDVVFLFLRLEDMDSRLALRYVSLSSDEIEAEIEAAVARLRGIIAALRERSEATVFVANFAPPARLHAGLADNALALSQTAAITRANTRLAQLCRSFAAVHVIDCARLAFEVGGQNLRDPKLAYLWRMPFSQRAQIEIGRLMARCLRAACFPPRKCLVLDLDHTLWGGVLSEEGQDGIALGEDYPGKVFKDFQQYILSLADQGVLLAVASKNNEADALAALEQHPDCLLRPEQFAALQIHWRGKDESLTAIAQALNIGLDSLAFFDDNPVERAWVRSRHPEVAVIEAPDSPMGYIDAVESSGCFDQLVLSQEDRARALMYAEERQRRDYQTENVSVEDFLRGLEMKLSVGSVDDQSLDRVVQLLGKTNQFNLTTRRHGAADVRSLLDQGAIALWMRVADRFGDSGLVGVAIAVAEQEGRWRIDSFLLSCRVIGRQVEQVLLAQLALRAQRRGCAVLVGEYLQTAKNAPAASFYPDNGFTLLDGAPSLFARDLGDGLPPTPDFVELHLTGEDTHV